MLNIEARHLEIIETILSKYDYSFFVFGSRITRRAKRLSDLDLFFLEHIPDSEVQKIETDFEDSDLPYKVDIVDFNKCDADFQNVMLANYICLKASTQLLRIESNAIGHFEYLPKSLGYSITVVNGVSVINCGLHSSMWNIAYGAPNSDIFSTVETIKQSYNGQPFAWWIPGSKHNPELSKALEEGGLVIEATEHAMICSLDDLKNNEAHSSLLSIRQVSTEQMLQDFISVLLPYDESVKTFYGKATLADIQRQERLFVGYEDSIPSSIGILYFEGESAGIFSVLTLEAARGKGYGTEMMRYMVAKAKDLGCKTVTLSASSDSGYRIYERLGFSKIGAFECFEYKVEQMNIEFTNSPKAEDIDFLTQKIDAESPEYDTCVPFAFFIRDTSGAIIAGVNGNTLFGRIYIDQLWVKKEYRKKGLATKLMDEVHNYGRTMDCHMATLTTMNFQNAREFYEKLGYVADFERGGYNDGSSCIFMRKDL